MAEALHVRRSCIYFVVIFKLQVPSPLLATLKKRLNLTPQRFWIHIINHWYWDWQKHTCYVIHTTFSISRSIKILQKYRKGHRYSKKTAIFTWFFISSNFSQRLACPFDHYNIWNCYVMLQKHSTLWIVSKLWVNCSVTRVITMLTWSHD